MEYIEKWTKYLKIKKTRWQKFKIADIVEEYTKTNGMPLYVWMLPVHTQHKESMLCHTKGMPICPIHLDAPCLDAPLYVGMSPYVSMAPYMFGHSHMFGCPCTF